MAEYSDQHKGHEGHFRAEACGGIGAVDPQERCDEGEDDKSVLEGRWSSFYSCIFIRPSVLPIFDGYP